MKCKQIRINTFEDITAARTGKKQNRIRSLLLLVKRPVHIPDSTSFADIHSRFT